MTKAFFLTIAALLLMPLASGCGGSSSDDSATVTVTSEATTDESAAEKATWETPPPEEKVAPAEEEGGLTEIDFDLTNGEGWHYQGTLPYPQQHVAFSKDIENSPPGYARPEATLVGTPVEPMEFADDNPGRPGGPTLTVGSGYFAYELPESFYNATTYGGPDEFGPCAVTGNSTYDFEPYNNEVMCELDVNEEPQEVEFQEYEEEQEGDGDEQQVEKLLRIVREFGAPMYVLNLDPIGTACNMFIQPDGTVEKSNTYDEDSCGSLKLTAR